MRKPIDKSRATPDTMVRLDDLLHAMAFVVARRQMQQNKSGAYLLPGWNLASRVGV